MRVFQRGFVIAWETVLRLWRKRRWESGGASFSKAVAAATRRRHVLLRCRESASRPRAAEPSRPVMNTSAAESQEGWAIRRVWRDRR